MDAEPVAALRIGELGRRVGVSEHVLRAWERRYGLLHPQRSHGGYRLYSEADERRVRRMQTHLARGLSAAEAARAALMEERETSPPKVVQPFDDKEGLDTGEGLAAAGRALARSLDTFDEPGAQAAIDRLLGAFTVEAVVRDVVLPYLNDLGNRWARGEARVAQEHFASNLLRGRLAGLARGWGSGRGPLAVLACAPGEQHDIALLAFGIVLRRNGWRVRYLGADTPVSELARTAREADPDLVVAAATSPELFSRIAADLSQLAAIVPLALAGAGATEDFAAKIHARLLTGDPVSEAEQLQPTSRG